MRIVAIKKVEDCFDGSTIYAYTFSHAWSRESILALDQLGQLDFYPDFPRPFFRVHLKGGCQAKGVEAEQTCVAIYPETDKETIKRTFEAHFGVSADAVESAESETDREEASNGQQAPAVL